MPSSGILLEREMAIKNWTVKTKSVEGGSNGIAAYGRYLEDTEHRNHKGKTESITPVSGNWRGLVMRQTALMAKRNLDKPKGGRPVSTLAQSFVLSLPPELKPTPDQWKKIAQKLIQSLNDALPASKKLGTYDSFVNAHENTNNPHLNIIIGKLAENGEIRKEITQKSALHRIKQAANAAIFEVLGVSNIEYNPRTKDVGNKPLWKVKKELAELAKLEESKHEAILNLNEHILDLEQAKAAKLDELAVTADAADRLRDVAISVGNNLNAKAAARVSEQAREVLAGASPAPEPKPQPKKIRRPDDDFSPSF